MVGIDRKDENSNADGRDMPAICAAAIVDMEREVPGNTADKIWAAPIQIAWNKFISSIRLTRGRVHIASTIHITIPPMSKAIAITKRLSRFLPISLDNKKAGTAVTTKATIV